MRSCRLGQLPPCAQLVGSGSRARRLGFRHTPALCGLCAAAATAAPCGPAAPAGTLIARRLPAPRQVARALGCRCFIAMPDDAAVEKVHALEALGARGGGAPPRASATPYTHQAQHSLLSVRVLGMTHQQACPVEPCPVAGLAPCPALGRGRAAGFCGTGGHRLPSRGGRRAAWQAGPPPVAPGTPGRRRRRGAAGAASVHRAPGAPSQRRPASSRGRGARLDVCKSV